jgi:hypothetical protein
MTDKAPTFLSRKTAVPATVEKPHVDKSVQDFLSNFIATGEAVQEQRREIERQEVEIEKLRARNGYADGELKRVARARDQFQAQYCELKIALEVIVTSAVNSCEQAKAAAHQAKHQAIMAAETACNTAEASCQSVIDQARASLAQVKSELVRAGIEPPGDIAPLSEHEETTVREFGARFAPKQEN